MLAVVLVGLWGVVLLPLGVAEVAARRHSSVAAFQASIRGLDRSTAGALAGPVAARPRRSVRRIERQQAVLSLCFAAAGLTLLAAVLYGGKVALALHAGADQLLVAYAAGAVASNRRW